MQSPEATDLITSRNLKLTVITPFDFSPFSLVNKEMESIDNGDVGSTKDYPSDNEEDNAAGYIEDPEYESFGYTGNLNLKGEAGGHYEDFKYKEICLPSNDELKHMTRKLVKEQLNVLRAVVSSCKAIKRARRNPKVKPKPVRMIVHGGAGKPYIIFCTFVQQNNFILYKVLAKV